MKRPRKRSDDIIESRHVALLKKGRKFWNSWRLGRRVSDVDLSFADLSDMDLSGKPSGSSFDARYNLAIADMSYSKLNRANLDFTNLVASNLRWADLQGAKMKNAFCNSTDFKWAKLNGIQAPYIDLIGANLAFACLRDSDLSHAFLGNTVFAHTDLKGVRGLASCKHFEASSVDFETIKSSPDIPLSFLTDCGLADLAARRLLELARQSRETVSCFISYSTKNEVFCEKLHRDLRKNGIHCWFAPGSMKVGDKMLDAIDRAIEGSSKVVLVLSKNSLESSWVEDEVLRAIALEREKRTDILLPIRIDSAVLQSEKGWAKKLRDSRHIDDFSKWESRSIYRARLTALLAALKTCD